MGGRENKLQPKIPNFVIVRRLRACLGQFQISCTINYFIDRNPPYQRPNCCRNYLVREQGGNGADPRHITVSGVGITQRSDPVCRESQKCGGGTGVTFSRERLNCIQTRGGGKHLGEDIKDLLPRTWLELACLSLHRYTRRGEY